MRAEAEILVDRVRKSDTKNGVREMYSNDIDIVGLYPFETFTRCSDECNNANNNPPNTITEDSTFKNNNLDYITSGVMFVVFLLLLLFSLSCS